MFATTSMALFSCTKDVGINPLLDYRHALEGDYKCQVLEQHYMAGTLTYSTTYTEIMTVSVDYTSMDKNSLLINDHILSNLELNTGYYQCYQSFSYPFRNLHASFKNDSVSYSARQGGNGGGINYTYKGKK